MTKTSGNCFYIVNLYFVNAFGLFVLSYRPSSFDDLTLNVNQKIGAQQILRTFCMIQLPDVDKSVCV